MPVKLPVIPNKRLPQREHKVPLKVRQPLALRDHVSGKSNRNDKTGCIQEMSVLLACFKVNDYVETPCLKEIGIFQKCVEQFNKEQYDKEEALKKGSVTGTRNLNHLQLNAVLEKFPTK